MEWYWRDAQSHDTDSHDIRRRASTALLRQFWPVATETPVRNPAGWTAIVVSRAGLVGWQHTYLNYRLILFKFHDKFKTLKCFKNNVKCLIAIRNTSKRMARTVRLDQTVARLASVHDLIASWCIAHCAKRVQPSNWIIFQVDFIISVDQRFFTENISPNNFCRLKKSCFSNHFIVVEISLVALVIKLKEVMSTRYNKTLY